MNISAIRAWRRHHSALSIMGEENAAPQSGPPQNPTPAELDPARQEEARRYARQRRRLSLVNLAISAVLIGVLLFTGLNFWLRDTLAPIVWWTGSRSPDGSRCSSRRTSSPSRSPSRSSTCR